ncbi:hypothetical protein [Wocania ichthyoenteri]|uniref:hypothetical protein n=1 Tax=Wocania ichthyoenteri TaxID=1230531 RepID=UPI00053E8CFA|nr:hypothetical protein [Wocania ichthyoenteri]
MNKSICFIFCGLCLFFNCKTINLSQTSQTNTTQPVSLGSIGTGKDFILQKGFNNTAVPSYKAPIKLAIKVKGFNKQSFKSFTKAKAVQSANVSINYIDSVANKPKYIQLQIADKVSLIKQLNGKENTQEKRYLSHNPYAKILTSITIAFSQKDIQRITSADAVFLIENSLKTYALQLHKTKGDKEIIAFNEGVVFEYQASNSCWQENSRHNFDIVDLVSALNDCPKKTYRSPKRAKKKINYFKL